MGALFTDNESRLGVRYEIRTRDSTLARSHVTTTPIQHITGAPSQIWTDDLLITNQLLYRWAIGANKCLIILSEQANTLPIPYA